MTLMLRIMIFILGSATLVLWLWPAINTWMSNAAASKPNGKHMTAVIGSKVPDLTLEATGGKPVNLRRLNGQNRVLVFYPGDNTPGCTIQLCALRDRQADFTKANTLIFAANPASLKSHQDFAERQRLPFPILVDENGKLAKAFGVGSKLGFTDRTVFLIDKTGTVRWSEPGMPSPDTLLEEINSWE